MLLPGLQPRPTLSRLQAEGQGQALMPRARSICPAAGCPQLQPCLIHHRRPWDHKGLTRQERGLGAEYYRNRPIVLREEQACGICGGPGLPDDVVDHKVARAKGGTSERSNLQRAHRECNQSKGARA